MPELNQDIGSSELENDTVEQQVVEQPEQEPTPEQAARDAQAAQMAKELGMEDGDADFDPTASEAPLTPEQEQAALKEAQDMLATPEGAEMAASGAIDWYEELLQDHGHERFTIAPKKKIKGTKRLTPVIQKYSPQMLGLFGQYKDEVMASIFVGSLAYGSVKQIRALKAEDLAADKRLNPEKYAEAANDDQITSEAV